MASTREHWSRRRCLRFWRDVGRSGFSLLELLIVLGIVAALIAILVPVAARVRARSVSVACQNHLRSIAQACHTRATECDGYVGLAGLIIAVVFVGSYWAWRSRPVPGPTLTTTGPASSRIAAVPDNSIAVLPFQNLSKDEENAFFADGVQDEILTDLAKIADLEIIVHAGIRLTA